MTVARAPGRNAVTIDEIVLLPGEDAIIAPVWVPWRDRIQPGDLSPGDLLPTDEDDPRLVPTYLAGDAVPTTGERAAVVDELGLGRSRVLSLEGRDLAAQRWYDGDQGPDVPLAQSAPGRCEWLWLPGAAGRPAVARRSACAPTSTPTTTAAWSRSTTAAVPTPRPSCARSSSRRRCPTTSSTPSAETTSKSF